MNTACLLNCPAGDTLCYAKCSREYADNVLKCPCEPGCPDGCPCPEYVCPVTTTTALTTTAETTTTTFPALRTDVLILNTAFEVNVPVITNAYAREDRNFYFLMGENTQVYGSCSVTYKNEHFVFGGFTEEKQISQIIGCELKRIGTLAFDHVYGACTNVADYLLYLCFNGNDPSDARKCRYSGSPTGQFIEVETSRYGHQDTRIAANNCKSKTSSYFTQ